MADGRVEVDFSAQCSADKIIVRGVNECTCCLNPKRELKEIQEELSSAKLIIKLLQTEGSTNEHVGYGTIEPRNLIKSNRQNAVKTKENKWFEVISSQHRRTKQVKIDPGKRASRN
jgi:NADPH-dependent glutamate synthase beta subunit-like oxidoreductase